MEDLTTYPAITEVTLDQATALLNDPAFRVKDMRMAQEYETWAVYWEFITPDKKWYRVTVSHHTDSLPLYKACWDYGVRNRPHLYGLFDKTESIMKDQHTQITGYRDLSQAEIDAMNRIKALAAEVGALIDSLGIPVETPGSTFEVDGRWLSIAKTDLQKGFMSLVRSVARPTTF